MIVGYKQAAAAFLDAVVANRIQTLARAGVKKAHLADVVVAPIDPGPPAIGAKLPLLRNLEPVDAAIVDLFKLTAAAAGPTPGGAGSLAATQVGAAARTAVISARRISIRGPTAFA